MSTDFSSVTEVPGGLVSRDAIDMVWTRYAFAAPYCTGRRVLEIACGPGVGLGHLACSAGLLIGGDYTAALLTRAQARHGQRVPLVRLDGHALPFRPGFFDVVVLFEALYFMADASAVVRSIRDTLAPGGTLILASVNPALPGFNPAPYSTRYHSAAEYREMLGAQSFSVSVYGGFPVARQGLRGKALRLAKRAAVALNVIPKTMNGKELLKRLVFGKLVPFPADVSEVSGTYHEPAPLADPSQADGYTVIYVVARKEG